MRKELKVLKQQKKAHPLDEPFKTELEGFEPSRHLRGLPHFECGPLQPLGYNSKYDLHGAT